MSRIVHVCVGGPYTDGFTYQENILTKHHHLLGYDVTIIASTLRFNHAGQLEEIEPRRYVNDDGVTVIRLPFSRPRWLCAKLKKVRGVSEELERAEPDIIFLHGIQSLVCSDVRVYLERHPFVRLFIDNHVDKSNMGGSLHKLLLDETLWRSQGKKLEGFAESFYGVLPARVKTLSEVYGIAEEKCHLLEMGYDDRLNQKLLQQARTKVSEWLKKCSIGSGDTILCTGGKIDAYKTDVWTLLQFVASGRLPLSMKLVVFGSVESRQRDAFKRLCEASDQIAYYGWADKYEMSALIDASDVGIYPGRHSVLWEQTAGQGKPLIIKTLDGVEHLDLGGNVICLGTHVDGTALSMLACRLEEKATFASMKRSAMAGASRFQYSSIAKKSIGLE